MQETCVRSCFCCTVKLDERHEAMLDRASLRINNFPFRLHGDTKSLAELLRREFSVMPTSLEVPTPRSSFRHRLTQALWRRTARTVPTQQKECPAIEPEVEIDQSLEYAKLRFSANGSGSAPTDSVHPNGSDTVASDPRSSESSEESSTSVDCAQQAASALLSAQVLSTFRAVARRMFFDLPAHVCAPFEPPGEQGLLFWNSLAPRCLRSPAISTELPLAP